MIGRSHFFHNTRNYKYKHGMSPNSRALWTVPDFSKCQSQDEFLSHRSSITTRIVISKYAFAFGSHSVLEMGVKISQRHDFRSSMTVTQPC